VTYKSVSAIHCGSCYSVTDAPVGGPDAVCIAAVAATFPDDTKREFFGDVPHQVCGWEGFPSITNVMGDEVEYKPHCFWIDGDNSYSAKPKAVSFHFDDLNSRNETLEAYTNNTDLVCKSAARMNRYYGANPDDIPFFYPILDYGKPGDNRGNKSDYLDPKRVLDSEQDYWPLTYGRKKHGGSQKPDEFKHFNSTKYDISQVSPDEIGGLRRREARAEMHSRKFAGQYVVSNRTEWFYTATKICNDKAAWGPHWLSTSEGKFCNMADRTLWDLCSQTQRDGCFDMDTEALYRKAYNNVHALEPSPPQPVLQLNRRIVF
jgi:hypothetical protein